MKTVVIFIGGYLPARNYGGPVTSIANLVENLGDELEFRIISNDHEFNETKPLPGIQPGWNQVGKAKVRYLAADEYDYSHYLSILRETKADIVYLSSVFYLPNLQFIRAAKKLRIPIVLAPRGELCENALNLGRTKKTLYISVMRALGLYRGMWFHATSEEERNNTLRYLRVRDSHVFLMPNMHGTAKNRHNEKKTSGSLRIIFLARIQEKKNLLTAIRAVKKAKGNIEFDIYGPMEQPEYWSICQKEIADTPERIRIRYRGAVEPSEAKEAFANYHCFLFPTLSENYGHVIAESLLCGCAMILSRGTTPWDDLENRAGFLAGLDDEQGFVAAIDQMVAMDQEEFSMLQQSITRYLTEKLKTRELKDRYLEMFKKPIREE